MALPEGFQSWKRIFCPFCHVGVIRGMGRTWFFTARVVFLGEVCIRHKSVRLHRQRAGFLLHGQVSQLGACITTLQRVCQCLAAWENPCHLWNPICCPWDIPPPFLPTEFLFPAARSFSRVQQAPGDRCKEDAKCEEDQPLQSPVLGAHRAQHCLGLSKMRAGFPHGEWLPPNPGFPGTSPQAGVT